MRSMLLLSKLSQHFIELRLIKSCWSCKYKLLIGRLEGIGEWDQFWHLIIWHCSPQISEREREREITPELSLTNTSRQTVIPGTSLNSRKLKSIQPVRRPKRWPGRRREEYSLPAIMMSLRVRARDEIWSWWWCQSFPTFVYVVRVGEIGRTNPKTLNI